MFDAHLHLSGLRHPQAVLEALKSGALDSCLVSTVTESEAGELLNRLQDYPAFLTIGAHPCFTRRRSFDRKALDLLLQSPRGGRLVAIGECGFDMHWKYGTEDEQRALLMMQAELASELDLPIIIHTRDADRETSEALRSTSFRCSGIMHCFSSGEDLMRNALDKGMYISFAGNITYKGNDELRRIVQLVPEDRLLCETDSPYLAPVPMRGKPSRPEYTEYTIDLIASLRGEDRDKLKEQMVRNLKAALHRDKTVRKLFPA